MLGSMLGPLVSANRNSRGSKYIAIQDLGLKKRIYHGLWEKNRYSEVVLGPSAYGGIWQLGCLSFMPGPVVGPVSLCSYSFWHKTVRSRSCDCSHPGPESWLLQREAQSYYLETPM